MDVTATSQAAATPVVSTPTETPGPSTGSQGVIAPSPAPNPTPQPTPPIVLGASSPVLQGTLPDAPSAPSPGPSRDGIAPAIAKLFGNAAVPTPIALNVSYRVVRNPNEIVTIFTDPETGKEVAQFPPEILVGLAQFFDQPRGVTLDKDA